MAPTMMAFDLADHAQFWIHLGLLGLSRVPEDGPMQIPAIVLSVVITALVIVSLLIGVARANARYFGLADPPARRQDGPRRIDGGVRTRRRPPPMACQFGSHRMLSGSCGASAPHPAHRVGFGREVF